MLKKVRDTWSSQNSKRKEEREWNTWRFQSVKNRDSPYFHGNHQKRESRDQRSTKIFRIRNHCLNFTHLHFLIKVYDLHLLRSGFWLSNIFDVSMPLIHTYLKLHSKPFRDRMKRRQNNQMPWWGSYTLSDRVNHLRNLHFIFAKLIKPLDRRLIKEWMIGNSAKTVLSCNRLGIWKSNKPHRN